MTRVPGVFVIAFACAAVAGFALWPVSAQKQPVNIYIDSPQATDEDGPSYSDRETALGETPPSRNEEETDSAIPDYSYPSAI